jgi:ABC-type antimicrobial peptide transport system permease subunit
VSSAAFDRIDRVSTAGSLLVATPRGTTDAAVVKRLRPAFGEMVNRQRPPDDVANLSRVSALPSVLAILVAVLATVSLVNALVTVTSRHHHDLGVYRALGFTSRQVVGACTTIGLAVGATAVLIGLPLGSSIAIWGWRAVEDWVGVRSAGVIPLPWVILTIVGALMTATAVAVIPSALATRQSPSIVLHTE